MLQRLQTYHEHVSEVCQECNYHIRALKHIPPILTEPAAQIAATSIVASRLDSLMYGTSQKNLNKLQRVQNSLARVVKGIGRRQHARPVLSQYHWLPIREKIEYKMALLAYKSRTQLLPNYLSERLVDSAPVQPLRSASALRLQPTLTRTKLAKRGFSAAAPTVWNNLTNELRSVTSLSLFKSKLKTHLYKKAYES